MTKVSLKKWSQQRNDNRIQQFQQLIYVNTLFMNVNFLLT